MLCPSIFAGRDLCILWVDLGKAIAYRGVWISLMWVYCLRIGFSACLNIVIKGK